MTFFLLLLFIVAVFCLIAGEEVAGMLCIVAILQIIAICTLFNIRDSLKK